MVSRPSRRPRPFDYGTILKLVAVFGATWALYDRLPDPMPSHFAVGGAADGWMPRSFRAAPVAGYTFVFVTMLSGLHLLILRASFGPKPQLDGNIWVLAGLALTVMGQLMPRAGRNALFGFRTKWSMAQTRIGSALRDSRVVVGDGPPSPGTRKVTRCAPAGFVLPTDQNRRHVVAELA